MPPAPEPDHAAADPGATDAEVDPHRDGPLTGLRVVDCATVLAGPACARYLGDFGAEVIKVERPPDGDTTRAMGWRHPDDDVTLWWRFVGRNKRTVALDLKDPTDLDVMRRLVATADVLVENFRPGTLERLGLDPADLIAANPRLVVTRVTGFGQDGPYAGRPGFASIAEAMSGFAGINGEADGPPLLPPIALTDEISGIVAAFATLAAVHSGVGQVVDVNLYESLLQMMGPLPAAKALLDYDQPRLGAGIPYSVPRGSYRCGDGRWVVISTSAESVAQRMMALVGLGGDPRVASFSARVEHRDLVDETVAAWVGARTLDDVLAAFEAVHAAAAPVHTMGDVLADPHLAARGSIPEVDGMPMQGLVARLSATPGRIRWGGRPLGADTEAVIAELGGDGADPAS